MNFGGVNPNVMDNVHIQPHVGQGQPQLAPDWNQAHQDLISRFTAQLADWQQRWGQHHEAFQGGPPGGAPPGLAALGQGVQPGGYVQNLQPQPVQRFTEWNRQAGRPPTGLGHAGAPGYR